MSSVGREGWGILGPGPGTALVILKYMIFKIVIFTSQLQDRSSRGESRPCYFLGSGGTKATLASVPSLRGEEREGGNPNPIRADPRPWTRVYASDPNRGRPGAFLRLRGSALGAEWFQKENTKASREPLRSTPEPCEYATQCVYLGCNNLRQAHKMFTTYVSALYTL